MSQRRTERPGKARMSDVVYERLQGFLLDGEIQPGERIRVDELARRLGVSQTPVRESLNRLEAEDLVTKTHLIGYSATPKLTPERFEDLFEARFLIEPYCSGLAAGRHRGGEAERIAAIAAEMRTRYQAGTMSYAAFARADAEFHEAVLAATGNSYFGEIFAKLHCHLQLFRLLRDSRVTEDALDEHDQIVTAIRQRSQESATDAMRAHLTASRTRLRTAFASPPEEATASASGAGD
ncbi:GntR family transcriptional regulator [Kribbella sp. VKM Ac-2569]|uniref:GntR family transcriptional regulator n=1 Tax=Kribbella sp. VKM Ac-2569 TaxID=2512220 RepID=UPI00102B9739|nr:GntR family transcriptional regulator [Kribbella sp. VKM Ac-2569]RZT27555.1 GntR family transcriptional regulator [Kribbella sp. VKM Ac-2569]